MKILIITGGSSGIGRVTAELFAKKDYKVYELSRHGESNENIIHIDCDVTKKEDCNAAVNRVIDECGRIDIFINNAGMGISGAIEFTDINEAKRQFDVNFFGSVNIVQSVISYMRQVKAGRIIFVSSLAAIFPIPYQGFYSASKMAINGLACALRNELREFNIDVCCLLPGDVKTGFTDARAKSHVGMEVYTKMNKAVKTMEYDEQHGLSAEHMARKLLKIANSKRTWMYNTVGFNYHIMVFLNKLLPKTLVIRILGMIYG